MEPQPDPRWANFIGRVDDNGRVKPMSYEILAGLAGEWTELLPDSMLVEGPADLLRQARSLFVQS